MELVSRVVGAMLAGSQSIQSAREAALQRGLRVAQVSLFVLPALVLLWVAWLISAFLLSLVYVPFLIAGKDLGFERVLNGFALYGFVLPVVVMFVASLALQLFSRLLWWQAAETLTGTLLVAASVAGRIAVLLGVIYIWKSGTPIREGVLLPVVVACSGIAWLGLLAERKLFRILDSFAAQSSDTTDSVGEQESSSKLDTRTRYAEEQQKSVFKRDVGAWLKGRFPRSYAIGTVILLPLAFILNAMADGNSVPRALLVFLVICPAILQIFSLPARKVTSLVSS